MEKNKIKSYDVEVAVAFTDGRWRSVMTTVEDPPGAFGHLAIEKMAEEKVLEDFMHGPRAVSFVKTIWIDSGDEIVE